MDSELCAYLKTFPTFFDEPVQNYQKLSVQELCFYCGQHYLFICLKKCWF